MSKSAELPDPIASYGYAEYGEAYSRLRFITPEEAVAAEKVRADLMASLEGKVKTGCLGTKTDCRDLSPGCVTCTEGLWSCLFINNSCNCSCFYCPASQDTKGEPATNSLLFPRAEDYVDYIERFGFKGVSISGGEPLLTPERSLKYLKAVKKRFGDKVYFWLYTNGVLATDEILGQLRDAGLDEIRFDIGATDNSLKMLKKAVGIIPRVTVEIPAIPEELEVMKERIVEMHDAGVNHLNLHQLRLTPYNLEKLVLRDYTFLRGEKITVLESEITALRLLQFSIEKGVGLPVNYCSFAFKNRFQHRASRIMAARHFMSEHESLTQKGNIRALSLTALPEDLDALEERFKESGQDGGLWQRKGKETLMLHPSLIDSADMAKGRLSVDYYSASIAQKVSYKNPFREVPLNSKRKVVLERQQKARDVVIAPGEMEWFLKVIKGEKAGPAPAACQDIHLLEVMPEGMQPYC